MREDGAICPFGASKTSHNIIIFSASELDIFPLERSFLGVERAISGVEKDKWEFEFQDPKTAQMPVEPGQNQQAPIGQH